jgi:benzil reductase ((S)-benzoin forming)
MKKTIVITGANRGLGKALVDVLIKDENCLVISISRSLSKDQQSHSSNNFQFIKVDLAENNVSKKITALKDKIGDESICFINNASIIQPIVKIEDLGEAAMDKTLSINMKSTMVIVNYLLKNFNNNPLTFVNISSGAANRAISNWSLYCSSKAFIQMFFNVAESEYEQHRFLNIDPGVMDTGMQKELRASNFPDVENFKELQKEGQLKAPLAVAQDILKIIEKKG